MWSVDLHLRELICMSLSMPISIANGRVPVVSHRTDGHGDGEEADDSPIGFYCITENGCMKHHQIIYDKLPYLSDGCYEHYGDDA